VTVAMADLTRPAACRPAISRAAKGGIQFCLNDVLDKATNPLAQVGLDRIEPVVKKVNSPFTDRLRSLCLHGNIRHGVVSLPASQRRMIRVRTTRRLRQPQFQPTSRRHRCRSSLVESTCVYRLLVGEGVGQESLDSIRGAFSYRAWPGPIVLG
jgi:hypothetical protein